MSQQQQHLKDAMGIQGFQAGVHKTKGADNRIKKEEKGHKGKKRDMSFIKKGNQ